MHTHILTTQYEEIYTSLNLHSHPLRTPHSNQKCIGFILFIVVVLVVALWYFAETGFTVASDMYATCYLFQSFLQPLASFLSNQLLWVLELLTLTSNYR